MAGQGEISVELRLLLDKMLRQDIPAAKAAIRANMQAALGASGGTPAATEKTAQAMDKVAQSTRRVNRELDEQLRRWRLLERFRTPRIIEGGASTGGGTGGWQPGATVAMTGGGLATPPPKGLGGGGPTTLATMASNVIHAPLSSVAQTAVKAAAGLAALRVAVGLVAFAFREITAPARAAAQLFRQMADAARTMYAKQLTSGGLPGGFVARRALLADVIGVGEDQVFQYGQAVDLVNKKLNFAVAVYKETTPSLTGVSYELRALGHDFKALGMLIANEVAPSVRKAVFGIRQVLESFGPYLAKAFRMALEAGIQAALAPTPLLRYLKAVLPQLIPDPGAAGGPMASSMRLQASAWERMGLVIGSGPGSNYPRETALNTRRIHEGIQTLIKVVSPRGESAPAARPKGNRP